MSSPCFLPLLIQNNKRDVRTHLDHDGLAQARHAPRVAVNMNKKNSVVVISIRSIYSTDSEMHRIEHKRILELLRTKIKREKSSNISKMTDINCGH